jgi:hypothetical protein
MHSRYQSNGEIDYEEQNLFNFDTKLWILYHSTFSFEFSQTDFILV